MAPMVTHEPQAMPAKLRAEHQRCLRLRMRLPSGCFNSGGSEPRGAPTDRTQPVAAMARKYDDPSMTMAIGGG